MTSSSLSNIDFSFIRYANCWEDPTVLLKAFDINSDSVIVSIASGGDNCFSLVSQGPKKVFAIDISEVQLFLVKLKQEAIRQLSREAYLSFAGFIQSTAEEREKVYKSLAGNLEKREKEYWEGNLELIRNGLIHAGKFEQYFQLFRNEFLLKIHDQKTIDGLFEEKSAEEQQVYYENDWYHPGWEAMHAKFFGKEMLGERGRDPAFMEEIKESVSKLILGREIAHLKSVKCQKNPFLYYILNNTFGPNHLPHYVQKENFEAVKRNIDKVSIRKGLLSDVLPTLTENTTHFNLSNIFEYLSAQEIRVVGQSILNNAKSDAKIAYWNFIVHRSLKDYFNGGIHFQEEISNQLSAEDHGYFYERFELDSVKK